MGYYTRYTLEVKGEGPILDQFVRDFDDNKQMCAYGGLRGVTALEVNGKELYNDAEACKWYDCDTDLKLLSKEYPNLLFTLSGKGEEAGDLWRNYYRNGHAQACRAKIIYDEPDLDRLPLDETAEQKAFEQQLAQLEAQKTDLLARAAAVDLELDSLSAK